MKMCKVRKQICSIFYKIYLCCHVIFELKLQNVEIK